MKFFSFNHKWRGLTLIETVMVVGLIAVGLGILSVFFLNLNRAYLSQGGLVQVAGSAEAIMGEINALVLPSKNIISSHTFSIGTYSSSASTLVLQIPSIDSSGNTITGDYDYAVIYKVGTNVYRRLEVDAASARRTGTKQLSGVVSALTFSYDNADFTQVTNVTVDVQTQTVVKQTTFTSHLNQKLYVRNKE